MYRLRPNDELFEKSPSRTSFAFAPIEPFTANPIVRNMAGFAALNWSIDQKLIRFIS
jgi:hypothetical protein